MHDDHRQTSVLTVVVLLSIYPCTSQRQDVRTASHTFKPTLNVLTCERT